MFKKIKKKRLIFFLPSFAFGGASESIYKLSKFLVKKNFSILLISVGKNIYKKQFLKIGCDVNELNFKRSLYSIFKYRKIIKNEISKNFFQTILISNIHYGNLITLISCFGLKNLKIILTERSSLSELNVQTNFNSFIKNKIILFLAKFIYPFSNLIITNSIYEKKFITRKFRIKKIVCIYPPSINSIKRKIIQNKKFIKNKIIYVGRLSSEKGVITIIKALSIVLKDYKFKFEIYGDGNEKKEIQKLIDHYKLGNFIIIKGFTKNKNKIFHGAILFINASKFEGLPNALVQSLNYKVFPICSNAPGGNIEVINFGKLGMSFKTEDYKDLSKKIKIFFKKKIKLNERMRVNHLKKFTEKNSNNKYYKILNNL